MRLALLTLAVAGLTACRHHQPPVPPPSPSPARTAPAQSPAPAPAAPSELDAFLATFVADVSAATSEEELLAIAERARAVDGVGEIVTAPGTPYPLRISFARRLDAEELAARVGWTVHRLAIDGLDQHRSIPELVMAAEAGG